MKLFSHEQERLGWVNRSDWHVRLWKHLLLEKLNTRWGYALGLLLALSVAWISGTHQPAWSWYFLAGIVLTPALLISFLFPRIGLFMLIGIGFGVSLGRRLTDGVPVGVLVDLWLLTMVAGIFYRQIARKNWSTLAHPLSIPFLVWFLYCVLELLNPWSHATLGWLFAFRSVAGWMLLYPIGLFTLTRLRYVLQLHRWWIGLVSLTAVYGLWQWIMGPGRAEYQWMIAGAERFDLLFNGSGFRVFSVFADPTAFGILCAITATITGIIGWQRGASLRKKWVSLGLVCLMMAAGLATESRIVILLPVLGLLFYTLLSLRKEALILSGALVLLWVGLMTIPLELPVWERMQQIANPWNSVGAELRDQNQHWVQPFIQEHPIGAGLGKTGILGQRFAPDLWLSQFPPDSAYVRLALETGFVGLLLYLTLIASLLVVGIRGMFRTRSPRIKALFQAYLTLVFLVLIAGYTQQVTTQLPLGLLFVLSGAIFVNLGRLERTDPKAALFP